METLDVETIEQIKNIVNIAKNNKVPLQKQKAKKAKKTKEVTLTSPISDALNSEPEKIVPSPEPVPVPAPEPVEPAIELPAPKKKRVQSEKQRAAFALLQLKRKEQVEKQKLVKKIEASKLLLENDVKLKIQKTKKLKGTTVDFNNFPEQDSDDESDESEDEPEPVKKQPWGTSTRNKKSIKKPPQPIKVVEAKYQAPVFF